jgi:hypothetical protein
MARWRNTAMARNERVPCLTVLCRVCVVFVMKMGGWVVMEGGR